MSNLRRKFDGFLRVYKEPEGDSEYDVVLATDKGMVAKWTREAMEECHEDWNAYIQQVINKIITHIVDEVVDEAKRK